MARPSSTAATIVEKLSSASTISEADLATAVPDPMAMPISAFFRAGASFTPSPVYRMEQDNAFTEKTDVHSTLINKLWYCHKAKNSSIIA